jgi:hypothetical protein
MMPAEGVFFRSWACITAVPRKKAKGDSSIRVNRIGKRFLTLPAVDFSMSDSGSRGERLDGVFEWLERGHFERNERPCDWPAARWLVVTGAAFISYFSLARSC